MFGRPSGIRLRNLRQPLRSKSWTHAISNPYTSKSRKTDYDIHDAANRTSNACMGELNPWSVWEIVSELERCKEKQWKSLIAATDLHEKSCRNWRNSWKKIKLTGKVHQKNGCSLSKGASCSYPLEARDLQGISLDMKNGTATPCKRQRTRPPADPSCSCLWSWQCRREGASFLKACSCGSSIPVWILEQICVINRCETREFHRDSKQTTEN